MFTEYIFLKIRSVRCPGNAVRCSCQFGKAVRFYETFLYNSLMVILEKFGTICSQTLKYGRLIVFLNVGTSRELSLGNGYVILNMLLIQGSQIVETRSVIGNSKVI